MISGEAFAFAVMIVAVGALIAFLDWISSNLDDAIDCDLSDVTAWGDVVEPPRVDNPFHDVGRNTQ